MAERVGDDRGGLVPADPVRRRDRDARRRAPAAVPGGVAERADCVLRERVHGHAGGAQLARRAVGGHEHGRDRHVTIGLRLGARHRAGHVLGTGDERRDEDRHDGVHSRVVHEDAEGAAERVGRGAGDQVDRVADGSLRRGERAQRGLGRLGEHRHVEAVGAARVGREDPRAARVREDRDRGPGR
jgi:hypothetical protein